MQEELEAGVTTLLNSSRERKTYACIGIVILLPALIVEIIMVIVIIWSPDSLYRLFGHGEDAKTPKIAYQISMTISFIFVVITFLNKAWRKSNKERKQYETQHGLIQPLEDKIRTLRIYMHDKKAEYASISHEPDHHVWLNMDKALIELVRNPLTASDTQGDDEDRIRNGLLEAARNNQCVATEIQQQPPMTAITIEEYIMKMPIAKAKIELHIIVSGFIRFTRYIPNIVHRQVPQSAIVQIPITSVAKKKNKTS